MGKLTTRQQLLACTVMAAVGILSPQAFAQTTSTDDNRGLQEIVVTAQKREQSVQDVPIAVTALTSDALQANRVTNVVDLSGLAPGVTVRVSAGGSQLPVFTVRGITSFGVVPGSDKQISQYLDGVYIGSPRGSIFDLPDLERIEVLRGPQGTLFGRNATAGAVSIVTREPKGEAGARAEFTVGNYDQYRVRGSVDLPQLGPFSAYFSFLHDERRGDMKNLGAGVRWDRSASPDPLVPKIVTSPKFLGNKNTDAVFAAVKFESGDFKTVYKFDWAEGDNTPEGTALVAVNPNVVPDIPAAVGNFVRTLISSQPANVITAPNGLRPKEVYNSFVVPSSQKMQGHNVTSTWIASDSITVKNIFAYRKSSQWSNSSIDGVSALPITAAAAPLFGLPAALIGQPFVIVGSQSVSRSEQWSDELQLNYDSDFLTLTVGGLWFHSKDTSNTFGFQGTQSFRPIVGGVFPLGNQTHTFNKLTSLAGYAQAEIHATPELDVILGGRITQDKKLGRYQLGTPLGTPQVITTIELPYRDTTPSYLIGVNYKPSEDILLYAKYSTAFVSGGSIAGFEFVKEKAKSVEGGVKADLLDGRLRTNLAIYWAKYKDAQSSSSATLVPGLDPRIGTFIISCCDIESKGFELDVTAQPATGLTMGGTLSYSDWSVSNVAPILLTQNSGAYTLTYRPKWTAGLWGQYQSEPIIGEAFVSLRADAIWQSKSNVDNNPARSLPWAPDFPIADPYWQVNARLALRDLDLGGVMTEVAFWSKNLTNAKAPTFALNLFNTLGSRNFIPARTYGVDFIIKY